MEIKIAPCARTWMDVLRNEHSLCEFSAPFQLWRQKDIDRSGNLWFWSDASNAPQCVASWRCADHKCHTRTSFPSNVPFDNDGASMKLRMIFHIPNKVFYKKWKSWSGDRIRSCTNSYCFSLGLSANGLRGFRLTDVLICAGAGVLISAKGLHEPWTEKFC